MKSAFEKSILTVVLALGAGTAQAQDDVIVEKTEPKVEKTVVTSETIATSEAKVDDAQAETPSPGTRRPAAFAGTMKTDYEQIYDGTGYVRIVRMRDDSTGVACYIMGPQLQCAPMKKP